MQGSTIHFFKVLVEDETDLTWEVFKDTLLERYSGLGDGSVFEQLSSTK